MSAITGTARVIPHVLVNEPPGSRRIRGLAGAERVRRAGHRLDGEAAAVDVGQRVAGEEHQVAVGSSSQSVRPAPRRSAQLDAGEAVVALEVGEAVVEPRRADRPRLAEVVLGPLHRRPARGEAALVGLQHRSPRRGQDEGVDRRRAERQVRMDAAAVRARVRAGVGGGRRDREALVGERVLDRERERERVAGLRMEHVLQHDAARLALADAPAGPADEAVDRVLRLGLVERELVPPPVELVGAVLEPVRPRDQHLAPPGGDLPVRW